MIPNEDCSGVRARIWFRRPARRRRASRRRRRACLASDSSDRRDASSRFVHEVRDELDEPRLLTWKGISVMTMARGRPSVLLDPGLAAYLQDPRPCGRRPRSLPAEDDAAVGKSGPGRTSGAREVGLRSSRTRTPRRTLGEVVRRDFVAMRRDPLRAVTRRFGNAHGRTTVLERAV